MTLKRVGFIGLGAMGLPMAKNLLKHGFEVYVAAHRNREPIEELKKLGAIECSAVQDIPGQSDVLISILPTDREMESVLLSDQILNGLSTNSILIEMTSGSPAMMKKVQQAYEQKGIRVLDGPVSGGTAGAEQGTLTVMAGGDASVLEEARPVLDAMAKNIYLVGEIGAGKAVKAINQMLAGIHMVATSEAVALAEKLGINKDSLKEVIGNSSGASWMFMNKLDTVTNREFKPGFKLNLMKKDVQIAVDEGADLTLPLAAAALELYKKSEKDSGELDFSAISKNIIS
jgi:3-hydroxyisobutyrate dehydrogenase-like beta-hydroxyacid dehydrogenase